MKLFTKLISPIVVVATVVVTVAILNLIIDDMDMPNYGMWTGIRPIEDKLKKLEAFAKEGPIDAIVLGSSIGDFGFSAELYSKLMSQKLGRPYRVFNFSTGGAELVTIPSIYRIASAVARPQAIFLLIPVQFKRSEELSHNSPDYILSNAPIGTVLKDPTRLKLAKIIWSLPIVGKSAALRDLILFGRYRNLIGEGMDTYLVTSHGDRISYIAGQASIDHMNRLRLAFEDQVKPIFNKAEHDLVIAQNTFFPAIDIKAMTDLKKIALDDSLKLYVLAHSSAAPIWMTPTTNSEYKIGRTQYFNTLAKSVDGELLNPLDALSVPDFATMEDTHLNTYGAHIYTRAVFQIAINSSSFDQSRPSKIEQASLEPIRSKESSFNSFSAVVMREQGDRSKYLRCRFIQNFAVPPFPLADLFFALRMPDGGDIISPATKLNNGEYEASFDLGGSDKKQALILRFLYGSGTKVPVSAPLASYAWTFTP